MDGCVDRCVDGCVDGCMDGCMDECVRLYTTPQGSTLASTPL